MTWFKVDDSFHSHPKVLATDADALGLWVVAGAWSSANLTDGFVPDHVLTRLLPDSDKLARKLITAGLWRRARGGHQFHDWTDFQPSAQEVRTLRERRAEAGRLGGKARALRKTAGSRDLSATKNSELSTGVRNRPNQDSTGPDQDFYRSKTPSKSQASASALLQPPTRPSPSSKEKGEGALAQRATRRPPCPHHRGQFADTCGPCRSERLAPEDS